MWHRDILTGKKKSHTKNPIHRNEGRRKEGERRGEKGGKRREGRGGKEWI